MKQEQFLTEKRINRFKTVVSQRQFGLTIILENIHDPHNIAAVLRSCDAVGVREIYVILTDKRIDVNRYETVKNTTSSGSRKWVNINIFTDVNKAILAVREKYEFILGTHLSTESKSLYDLNLTQSTALVFGNEHEGISEELLSKLDGNFIIPQYGMVQSLNISVACAVSLYEALRQREQKDMYLSNDWTEQHQKVYNEYVQRSKPKLSDI